jgi:acetyl-CoA carboxylase biotin carboxyl carrier protein
MTPTFEMELDELRQITSWLVAGGIEFIEIGRPGVTARLTMAHTSAARSSADAVPDRVAPGADRSESPQGSAPQASGLVVAAPSVGVFRAGHPARRAPMIDVGSHVKQGDVVGVLQIAELCVPVIAPAGGRVVRVLAEQEAVVGYGSPLLELEIVPQA